MIFYRCSFLPKKKQPLHLYRFWKKKKKDKGVESELLYKLSRCIFSDATIGNSSVIIIENRKFLFRVSLARFIHSLFTRKTFNWLRLIRRQGWYPIIVRLDRSFDLVSSTIGKLLHVASIEKKSLPERVSLRSPSSCDHHPCLPLSPILNRLRLNFENNCFGNGSQLSSSVRHIRGEGKTFNWRFN